MHNDMNKVREFKGQIARQGDVLILRLPEHYTVSDENEISPSQGKLVLLEGEMTGHHHAIDVMNCTLSTSSKEKTIKPKKTNKIVEDLLYKAGNVTEVVTKLFRDENVVKKLVEDKILTRSDLYVGTLVVQGGGDVGVLLKHQEHAPIRLTQGNYYIGRQIENAGAEERYVRD